MLQPLGPGRKCCQQCSVRLSNRRGHCHRTRGADRAAERAPHAEQANRLLLLRLTAEDAAVGDGASEAPGEHVFGSDHHGELLYGCGLSDKGCTTALRCQREVPCVVGEPTLQRAVHKHEGVVICHLVGGRIYGAVCGHKTLKLRSRSCLFFANRQLLQKRSASVSAVSIAVAYLSLQYVTAARPIS